MALTYTYTTKAEMESIFGTDGILLRLDDDRSEAIDGSETANLTDVIEEASHEINFHCVHRYEPATLSANTWIRRACSLIACYFLSRRQGDPEQYQTAYDQAMQRLLQIRENKMDLPLTALRHDETPAMSNLRVDERYYEAKVRVQDRISEGGTDGAQDLSHNFYFDP